MQQSRGQQLAEAIREKTDEMARVLETLDEETARRAPAGRWSPREIITHLCGAEGRGMLPLLTAYLERDTPEIYLRAEDPFYTGRRQTMTLSELIAEFKREHEAIAAFIAGLSDAQLARKARVALLKDTPLGEYPTLAAFASGLGEYHMDFHINHLREILGLLGKA